MRAHESTPLTLSMPADDNEAGDEPRRRRPGALVAIVLPATLGTLVILGVTLARGADHTDSTRLGSMLSTSQNSNGATFISLLQIGDADAASALIARPAAGAEHPLTKERLQNDDVYLYSPTRAGLESRSAYEGLLRGGAASSAAACLGAFPDEYRSFCMNTHIEDKVSQLESMVAECQWSVEFGNGVHYYGFTTAARAALRRQSPCRPPT
jgi:hypothetical protein